ncbi:glycoside hydrolase family 2 TIM barrel-domain containing protein [Lentilactobacillus sp. Marseille-Q4993]|uniref:glycoside hydrolase family 2 TIM barrel-domain containing protein n=1 Tax=Lentilactobacillus sp. Marseille-Q4993 TaxID=3039492 RepID=UPI0024BCB96A|nr:glycoside hydrolase family 2 TIM barrel-domain containing protein [Lentilactobacillus sp. Marseille-Q4993]
MKPSIEWLDDPETFRVGVIPAHSDHHFYRNYTDFQNGRSKFVQSLNGNWRFKFAKDPSKRPVGFFKSDYDYSDFDTIKVPSHIELNNYGQIQYINTLYPWEGRQYRRPAYVPDESNPQHGMFSTAPDNTVGAYIREFEVDPELKGNQIVVRFEGVERAMFLWLNGHFLGYCEDSFTPSEYDLTPYLVDGTNKLAVEVFKHSTASFLEDQDMFRFSGIFRNVSLVAKPKGHIEDLHIIPTLSDDLTTGNLKVITKVSDLPENAATIELSVISSNGRRIAEDSATLATTNEFEFNNLKNIHPWNHKGHYLYNLMITVLTNDDNLIEMVPYQFGFRKIEVKDKVILLNNERLRLNGVNRHEWSATNGRAITMADMLADIKTFKKNNINAVRTCHYPDQISWYYLCDQNGIYMMAENNLESHGSWQKMGAVEPSYNVPGSSKHWLGAVLDRAKNNYETFKNHTSILFWSLGNESYAGDDIKAMNDYYKEQDPYRLTHYEGVCRNRKYEDTISDVESMMYFPPKDVANYLENNPKKPFLSCEFMHDMGNSMGGLNSYMQLYDKYQGYSGGFIWDYIDQAIQVTDPVTGNQVIRYGGDFDERHSDYEFSGDGIMFADRTEKPAMQEVKYYYGKYSD